jgi:hypothetical protein
MGIHNNIHNKNEQASIAAGCKIAEVELTVFTVLEKLCHSKPRFFVPACFVVRYAHYLEGVLSTLRKLLIRNREEMT